jgi:hypothetical protein
VGVPCGYVLSVPPSLCMGLEGKPMVFFTQVVHLETSWIPWPMLAKPLRRASVLLPGSDFVHAGLQAC